METITFEPSMFTAILPELALVILAALVLILDLVIRTRDTRWLAWISASGLIVAGIIGVLVSQPGSEPQMVLGGMLRQDWAAYTFRLIFLLAAAVTILIASGEEQGDHFGEYCVLVIVAALGMSLMASSANLIMLYLAIETTSLPLYILAGFRVKDNKSVEAGIKYVLYGAMTSAVMLYGFSLLWGFTGTANLYELAAGLQSGAISPVVAGGTALIILVGFGFKISAVPFHFWAPDVYEGAPTSIAGYLSTASKAAGFAVLARVLTAVYPEIAAFWTTIIAVLAAASMIVGNLLALTQKNLKRLLAYSSIAQAGYILVGVAAHSELGSAGMVYYLASYLVTNLAAFGIVWLVGQQTGSYELEAFAGLGKRNPAAALGLLAALLSLGGIPPLSGFFGKLLVFGAAIQAGQIWLAVVGVLTSVIGLFYYLTIMKVLYQPGEEKPLAVHLNWRIAIVVCVIGMVFLGTVFAPMYNLSILAAGPLF